MLVLLVHTMLTALYVVTQQMLVSLGCPPQFTETFPLSMLPPKEVRWIQRDMQIGRSGYFKKYNIKDQFNASYSVQEFRVLKAFTAMGTMGDSTRVIQLGSPAGLTSNEPVTC